MVNVWSYGGGKQSVAIAALIVQGKLPKPDLIVMADTGRERSSTWRYLNDWIRPILSRHGMAVQIAPHSLSTVDLWRTKNDDGESKPMLLIPAFTTLTKSGEVAKLPTYCSNEWKRRVVMRWLKARGIERAEMWLGISRDEAHRMKDSDVKWLSHRYPLIDLMMNRETASVWFMKWDGRTHPKAPARFARTCQMRLAGNAARRSRRFCSGCANRARDTKK